MIRLTALLIVLFCSVGRAQNLVPIEWKSAGQEVQASPVPFTPATGNSQRLSQSQSPGSSQGTSLLFQRTRSQPLSSVPESFRPGVISQSQSGLSKQSNQSKCEHCGGYHDPNKIAEL